MKRPRYYCEHCGAEVKRNSKICPHCGSFFSSVKCPKCEYSGRVSEFDHGCPVCGYRERATAAPEPFKAPPLDAGPLPVWVYVGVGLAFVAILALLFRAMR